MWTAAHRYLFNNNPQRKPARLDNAATVDPARRTKMCGRNNPRVKNCSRVTDRASWGTGAGERLVREVRDGDEMEDTNNYLMNNTKEFR